MLPQVHLSVLRIVHQTPVERFPGADIVNCSCRTTNANFGGATARQVGATMPKHATIAVNGTHTSRSVYYHEWARQRADQSNIVSKRTNASDGKNGATQL